MYYYLVTIAIADEKFESFKSYEWICANLRTALKCANHKAFVYDFKPLDDRKWEKISRLHFFKSYDKGYISIEKHRMWEKIWD